MSWWNGLWGRLYDRLPVTDAAFNDGATSTSARAKIAVKGMTCAACSAAVEQALRAIPGVTNASVALLQNMAEVEFNEAVVKPARLVEAVDDAGFDAALIHELEVAKVAVTGMTCAACSSAVENVVMGIPGVVRASVSLLHNQLEAHFDPSVARLEKILEAVDDAGFGATKLSSGGLEAVSLLVSGMTLDAHAAAVARTLLERPGVGNATVDIARGSVEVSYDPDVTGPRHLIAAIESCGFGAQHDDTNGGPAGSHAVAAELGYLWNLFINSLYFTIPVFVVAMVLPKFPGMAQLLNTMVLGFPCQEIIKWVLATPVQYVIGWRFHRGAWMSLKRGTANMDVLVVMGSNSSYIYSVISVLHHHYLGHHMSGNYIPTDFFETSAMIITVVLFGKYWECKAKGKTSAAIDKLLQLAPKTATVVELDDRNAIVKSYEVPTSLIHKGDVLRVLPGEKIPTDGEVLEGMSYVDESMVTGEAGGVQKDPGSEVTGGTISGNGVLLVKATRVGSKTTLNQIVQLTQRAQMAKAPVQRFADTVASIFVPVVLLISLVDFLAWYIAGVTHSYPDAWLPVGHTPFLFALLFSIAVMVIACPCALGLATPTAVKVGTEVAASLGVLVKGGDALERASKVTTVVFDKTGTVTQGKPTVSDLLLFDKKMDRVAVCRLVGSAEGGSNHPLARAILSYCAEATQAPNPLPNHLKQPNLPPNTYPSPNKDGIAVITLGAGVVTAPVAHSAGPNHQQLAALFTAPQNWQEEPGLGVTCDVANTSTDGRPVKVSVAVGNRKLMMKQGVDVPKEVEAQIGPHEELGYTCVMVAVDGLLAAVLEISDPLKPEACGVVRLLQQQGMRVCLLTGDNAKAAGYIAQQLGITDVTAEVMPQGKTDKIAQLKKEGEVVAMVGDGINDAPALATADVGMAIGSGTDIAIESAHYVLMRNDLQDVATALDISRQTLNRIRINYAWAMGYNIIMIPAAAGVFYPCFHFKLPPMYAAACMALSSLSVMVSSWMLHWYKRPVSVLEQPLPGISSDDLSCGSSSSSSKGQNGLVAMMPLGRKANGYTQVPSSNGDAAV